MLGMLATTGRLLAAHWPALLAWYLAGTIGHYAAIELAGWAGAFSDLAGALLLPLAPLARLTSYVAMLAVVREGLRHLEALAPLPADRAERRRAFGRMMLGGMLPFVALYTAYSYMTEDMWAFITRALDVRTEVLAAEMFQTPGVSQPPREWDYVPGEMVLSPVSVAIVVLAFALRWALGRKWAKERRWLVPFTVYLEALWVTFTFMLLIDILHIVTDWISGRVAMVWLGDARDWLTEVLFPVVWTWDGLMWLVGETGGVVLLPVAWLTVAGTIYGQAVAAKAPALSGIGLERVHRRYRALGAPVKRVVRDASTVATSRFEPIWKAIVLMWRAGPVLIGGYVLLFTILGSLEVLLWWAITRLIGPQDFYTFWLAIGNSLRLIPEILLQVVLVALVAAGYDATLRRLTPEPASAAAQDVEAPADSPVAGPGASPTPPAGPVTVASSAPGAPPAPGTAGGVPR